MAMQNFRLFDADHPQPEPANKVRSLDIGNGHVDFVAAQFDRRTFFVNVVDTDPTYLTVRFA